jgi:hypothetical protein
MKKNEILNYLKENTGTLKEMVCECNCYDGSLEYLYYYDNDEDFFRTFFNNEIDEAVRAVCYGDYRYMDAYVQFNGYGNLESKNEWEVEKELEENVEEIFDAWYDEYLQNNVDTNDNELKDIIKNGVEE